MQILGQGSWLLLPRIVAVVALAVAVASDVPSPMESSALQDAAIAAASPEAPLLPDLSDPAFGRGPGAPAAEALAPVRPAVWASTSSAPAAEGSFNAVAAVSSTAAIDSVARWGAGVHQHRRVRGSALRLLRARRRARHGASLYVLPQEPQDFTTKPPSGSAIWDRNRSWYTVISRHPDGLISNINGGQVVWSDASYLSLNCLLALSLVCYPVMLLVLIMVLTFIVSLCLVRAPQPSPGVVVEEGRDASDAILGPLPPVLPVEQLTAASKRTYAIWAQFCCTVPSLFVFGLPAVLVGLSWPLPQEVFTILTLVSSALMFSNGVYMVVFAGSSIMRMRRSMATDYGRIGVLQSDPTTEEAHEVSHWVVMPQYKEDVDNVSMALRSIANSRIARSAIGVVIALEERESAARSKAEFLQERFSGCFRHILVTYHPANLPNDPPGKASNMAWAFKELVRHLRQIKQDPSKVVLTVSDADSEFHVGYFDALSRLYLQAGPEKRDLRIWQSPVFHLKNYHRQPLPIIVGTMFTCMQELAGLSDPNAIRFPYSTYSLSLELARRVGGWDPEWIAEDWHMGIKCFLLTLGQSTVEPLLLPTLNYTPEDVSTCSTIDARWSQAKRHALGFSDVAYYFMMLPLVFGHAVADAKQVGSITSLQRFWSMAARGMGLVVKLVNVHVIIGVLAAYGFLTFTLRFLMFLFFRDDRHVQFLVDRTHFNAVAFTVSTLTCMLIVTLLFLGIYDLMKNRIEGKPFRHWTIHWLYTAFSFAIFGPLYFLALGAAVWKAAFSLLTRRTFEYEVAAKPTAAQRM